MAEFFAMGGKGAYIWSAYGLSALVIIAIAAHRLLWLRAARKLAEDARATEHSDAPQ